MAMLRTTHNNINKIAYYTIANLNIPIKMYVISIRMSQWGSKSLADQGYTAMDIIRYYYGENMYINSAEEIAGIPSSWPGYTLDIGATGQKVEQLQEQLNAIAGNYPLIPKIPVDGIYGERTQEAVEIFQEIFGLPRTGTVDYRTWFRIQDIYVAVTRIAELV